MSDLNSTNMSWVVIGSNTIPVSAFYAENGFMYMSYSRLIKDDGKVSMMVRLHYKDGSEIKSEVKSPISLREMLVCFYQCLDIDRFCGIDLSYYDYFCDSSSDDYIDEATDVCEHVFQILSNKKKPDKDMDCDMEVNCIPLYDVQPSDSKDICY